MRPQDLARLSQPYANAAVQPDRRLADALAIGLPAIHQLGDAITADLDPIQFGIGWWAPHPGTSRRILISDHLVQCVGTISRNLISARLHLLELAEWRERENDFLARSISVGADDRVQVNLPARTRPLDDVPTAMRGLHVAGFFRSILSALDCLGAATVGVLALPISIRYSSMSGALNALGAAQGRVTPGEALQDDFRQSFYVQMAQAGPTAWFEWALGFRNMLTHRARRLEFNQLVPDHILYNWAGRPIIRTEVVHHLARDPGLSDVEALLRRATGALVLTESAESSLAGVLGSTVQLAEGAAVDLLAAWNARRQAPNLLHQPPQQWPEGARQPAFNFDGYAPGSVPVDPGMIRTAPEMVQRLLASALDDAHRALWATFN